MDTLSNRSSLDITICIHWDIAPNVMYVIQYRLIVIHHLALSCQLIHCVIDGTVYASSLLGGYMQNKIDLGMATLWLSNLGMVAANTQAPSWYRIGMVVLSAFLVVLNLKHYIDSRISK